MLILEYHGDRIYFKTEEKSVEGLDKFPIMHVTAVYQTICVFE